MPRGASARGGVTPSFSYLLHLAMDDTNSSSQDMLMKPMDSPLGHPYGQYRKCPSSSTLSLAADFPPVPALPAIKDPRLGSWNSDSSIGLDHDPVTAFLSFMEFPSAKLDISPPAVAPHGCLYVKHGSGITVILSGHKAGTSLPLYPSGSSISGMVVLSKLEGIESLDVKVGDPFICVVLRHTKLIFALVGRIHICTRNPGRPQEKYCVFI
jgi:hypothetical protein